MKISEGTISMLIGCHQFILHPLWVLIAWYKEYRSWPNWWQFICIFLHDIGHFGKDYLSDKKQKEDHWKLGAQVAGRLFGEKGFLFVAGHSTNSGYPHSALRIPDKRSWIVAPQWWLTSNSWFEDFGRPFSGKGYWKQLCIENAKNGYAKGAHDLYLEHRNDVVV